MTTLHELNTDFTWTSPRAETSTLSADQAAQFDESGFVVVPGAFTADELAPVIKEIDAAEEATEAFLRQLPDERFSIAEAGAITFCPNLAHTNDVLRTFATHPVLLGLCRDLVGDDVDLYWDQAVYKKPQKPRRFPWHQDNGYTFVEPQQYLTCWVALNDAVETNGCPQVAVGLHRSGTLAHTYVEPLGWQIFEEAPDVAVAEASAGSIVVFSSLTPHLTGPNLSDGVRKAYILQYSPAGARIMSGTDKGPHDVREGAHTFPVLREGFAGRMIPDCFSIAAAPRGPVLESIEQALRDSFAASGIANRVGQGQSVAIGAGSRGITDGPLAVSVAVDLFSSLGAKPFIVPAMGSHGGATAAGQAGLLAGYGITEEALGVPVRATMDTVEIGRTSMGTPVYLDANAAAADHVFLVNRIKPHTNYSGTIESGLGKMSTYGLGKQRGADTYHRATAEITFDELVSAAVPILVEHGRLLGGFALIERSDDRTAEVHVIAGDAILTTEPALLTRAKELLGTIPFETANLVILDQIGKNISGTGLDPNVVGRKGNLHNEHPRSTSPISVDFIAVRSLSPETKGNALGIGTAEVCRSRVLDQMDHAVTRMNAATARDLTAAFAPVDAPTDRAMIELALGQLGPQAAADPMLIWVKNTLAVGEAVVSAAYWELANERADIEVTSERVPLAFDGEGNLVERF